MTKDELMAMSYEEMLRLWRFAKVGDPRFVGKSGKTFSDIMRRKREADIEGAIKISKIVGWA
jgi:hypothetical protein